MIDWNDPRTKQEFRAALGDAIDTWLEKQLANFGKWSLRGFGAICVAVASYLYFYFTKLGPQS